MTRTLVIVQWVWNKCNNEYKSSCWHGCLYDPCVEGIKRPLTGSGGNRDIGSQTLYTYIVIPASSYKIGRLHHRLWTKLQTTNTVIWWGCYLLQCKTTFIIQHLCHHDLHVLIF